MRFRRSTSLIDVPEELAKLGPALGSAFTRFGRGLGRASRRTAGQPRTGNIAARLPSPQHRHPQSPAVQGSGRLKSLPASVRRRTIEVRRQGEQLRGNPVTRGAQRAAQAIRERLLALRRGLARLRDRFRGRRSPRAPRWRSSAVADSTGDKLVTALLVVGAAMLYWDVTAARGGNEAANDIVLAGAYVRASEVIEARVHEVAEAIASAEGYYAAGPHDGQSLPYRLNNPGSLKKPALGAGALPTWKDTGLIEFPSPEMGWDALRHQVRLMLTGTSGVYQRSDALLDVGDKYADGDRNWAINVAAALGVSTNATLADLVPAHEERQ